MEFTISTNKKQEFIDITQKIKDIVEKSKISKGICNIFVPHATAAVTINENADPNLSLDIIEALDDVCSKKVWRHDALDNNAASHIKSAIIGPSETIPISNGELVLGTWQDIFLCEFDGPRKRRIITTIIKE